MTMLHRNTITTVYRRSATTESIL